MPVPPAEDLALLMYEILICLDECSRMRQYIKFFKKWTAIHRSKCERQPIIVDDIWGNSRLFLERTNKKCPLSSKMVFTSYFFPLPCTSLCDPSLLSLLPSFSQMVHADLLALPMIDRMWSLEWQPILGSWGLLHGAWLEDLQNFSCQEHITVVILSLMDQNFDLVKGSSVHLNGHLNPDA